MAPVGRSSRVRCQWHLPHLEDGDAMFDDFMVAAVVTSLAGRIRFGMSERPSRVVICTMLVLCTVTSIPDLQHLTLLQSGDNEMK